MRKMGTSMLIGVTLLAGMRVGAAWASGPSETNESPLLKWLQEELKYSMERLASADGENPYYMAYTVTDRHSASVQASLGAVTVNDTDRSRVLDVDLRVGSRKLDNTHQIRGGRGMPSFAGGVAALPIENDPAAIKEILWLTTDRSFKSAVKRLTEVLSNVKVMVEAEDQSDDFSVEEPSVSIEAPVDISVDREAWAQRLRKHSMAFRAHPQILDSAVSLSGIATNRLVATSEGTKLQLGRTHFRLSVSASTVADDGMELNQFQAFDSQTLEGLPDDQAVEAAIAKVIKEVEALRQAPVVEPYTGPAILQNRASGVFFHEIFGHRIEGHRQKDEEEGQTFTKKIGKQILPEFINIHDAPNIAKFGSTDLNGYYQYDDQGIPAQDVTIVDHGVLKTFLMSRSPVAGFDKSNGHGRREPGRDAVSRQGNLIVQSEKAVPYETLRQMLVEECKKLGKPFGLVFEDISGGYTTTRRRGMQAFKVNPIIVYRVYTDGRPDELVRGVDVVGTPLSCFERIVCTGDDPAIFNGTCGAESGWVPVSAISPSILVSQIEIEKKEKSANRPPILPAPLAEIGTSKADATEESPVEK